MAPLEPHYKGRYIFGNLPNLVIMASKIYANTSLNISKIIDEKKLSSDAEFARVVGVTPQTVSKWRSRNTYDITKIVNAFPDISVPWLLSGEGPMCTKHEIRVEIVDSPGETPNTPVDTPDEKEEEYELLPRITEDRGRPYYDVDFLGGYGEFADDPASAPVAYMIDYPPYNKEGVFYMNVRGDSMAPEINSGDLVALRPIEAWYDFLLLGKVYAVVTLSGQRTIKRLRRGSDNEHYTLEPINPAYESQEIPKAQIERVFEVLGGIRRYE